MLVLAGLSGALSGCLSAPTYDIKPAIEFKDLKVVRYSPARPLLPIDTFKITVSFKDGNGDLGITADEASFPPNARSYSPFSAQNPDGSVNANQYNYLIRFFYRRAGTTGFIEYAPPGNTYFGRYPPLNGGPDAKAAPLKGDLTYKLFSAYGSPLLAGDEVKFTVSIKDRALNESNTVTTSTYVVPPR